MDTLTLDVNAVLMKIKNGGNFNSITRATRPYDLYNLMEVVEAVGKQRHPKFAIDDENRFVYENIVRWIMGDPRAQAINPETGKPAPADLTKGVIICGSTGSGKSWAMEILSQIAEIVKASYKAGRDIRPLAWPCVRAFDICNAFSKYGEVDVYYQRPVLCIQDLGSEPAESIYMGNRVDVLRQLLEYRGDCNGKLTLITSNLTYDEMPVRYGDRVASRLFGMCNYYQIVGKDRRRV